MTPRETLAPFVEAKLVGPLQIALVEMLERMGRQSLPPAARIAIAFASVAPDHGHTCADLFGLQKLVRLEGDQALIDALPWPDPNEARDALAESPVVRALSEERATPLVLDESRLYLDRYFLDERLVFDAIAARLSPLPSLADNEASELEGVLDRLFADGSSTSPEQRRAAATALLRKLTVITGGPGTGKTTTVVRLLLALLEKNKGSLRIVLMAPTGKAAARMAESIRAQVSRVDSEYRDSVPLEASTIHRALGVIPNKPGRFRHDADNPLPVDVVVVDEASMVDLPLMARLFEALPPAANLILLGDRHQLASVNAGAVLGDLCGTDANKARLSEAFATELSKLAPVPKELMASSEPPPIADAVTSLSRSHRFNPDEGIGLLAKAINEGDQKAVASALPTFVAGSSERRRVEHVKLAAKEAFPEALQEEIVKAFKQALEAASPEEALERLGAMRVLCAHRRGSRGVEELNQLIVRWLAAKKLIQPSGAFYKGRLVMVTENDYGTQLFNGDVGIVLADKTGALQVYFEAGRDKPAKVVSPSRLPAHETAYAMTIHKSQGSEFGTVVVVLPDEPSPIVTRELLYTGVTRAKERVVVVGNDSVVQAAVRERVIRGSGLEAWLWNHRSNQ